MGDAHHGIRRLDKYTKYAILKHYIRTLKGEYKMESFEDIIKRSFANTWQIYRRFLFIDHIKKGFSYIWKNFAEITVTLFVAGLVIMMCSMILFISEWHTIALITLIIGGTIFVLFMILFIGALIHDIIHL